MNRIVSLTISLLVIAGCGQGGGGPDPYDLNFDIPRTETFANSLSAYGLYQEPLASLLPAEGALPYALSSELFTDYAFKQRLVMVPERRSVTTTDDTLAFPEGTVLAKTFYYPSDMRDPESSLQVIETRLLVKTEGVWNVATYLWNAEQTDATLLLDGTTTEISWIDETGQSWTTDYAVPHEGECVTCHQSDGPVDYIGPKLRNLNRTVTQNQNAMNQLAYLHGEGILDRGDGTSAPSLPDYRDPNRSLEERARAYLDVNCAHCHNPGGWDEAAEENLDFRFETPLDQTGLLGEAEEIREQLETGEMPFLGTTLPHSEGIRLVLDYVDSL